MAIINYINTGSGANSGDGDSLRTAFSKINSNFDSLVSNFVAAGVTSWNGRVGIVEFTNTDLLTLLGYTPYPSTNPDGFITSSTVALSNYAKIDYVNTTFVFVSDLSTYNFASTNYVDLKLTEYPTLTYLDDQQYLTSINLPNFLTQYVTETELAANDTLIRNYTNTRIFQEVNDTSIIPAQADIFNLGEESFRWSTLYLSDAVYIKGIGISIEPLSGKLLVDGNDPLGGFTFNAASISRSDQISFSITNNNGIQNSSAWLQLPGINANNFEAASLVNTGTAGVSLVSGDTQLRLTQTGVLILGNLSLPLRLQGQISTVTSLSTSTTLLTSGDHYLEVTRNSWLRTFYDEDVVIPQTITSRKDTNTFSPLNLKGDIVSLISNTLTDYTRTLDIEFSGLLSISQQGVYIGLSDTEGSGNPGNSDSSFEGYKLPLSRGRFGQILAVTSTSTYVDTVEWVTPSGGTSADLLNVGNHILPAADLTYDLGSTSSQWRSLYVGTSTIYIGGTSLSVIDGGIAINGTPITGSRSASWAVDASNNFVPSTDNLQDLGSPTNRVRHIYVGPGSITIGNSVISESVTGKLVLPGITRGVNYTIDEVEENGDQTYSFPGTPIVIDAAYYDILRNVLTAPQGYQPPQYEVDEMDDGEIDRIIVVNGGAGLTQTVAAKMRDQMRAYVGSNLNPINNFQANDWIVIPFTVSTEAADVEYEIGGGTADLGDFKISDNTLGTKAQSGTGWGYYNMYLDPGGESNAYITIPSVPNQTSGQPLEIYNKGTSTSRIQLIGQGGIEIRTNTDNDEYVFEFDDRGVLRLPSGGDIVNSSGQSVLGGASNPVTVDDTAPSASQEGKLWYNNLDGRTYVSYNGTWVDTNPVVVPAPGTYLDEITIDGSTINMNGSTLAINTAGVLLVNGSEVTGTGGSIYTPTTPADWLGSPTVGTITAGLDELAGRTVTLEDNKDRITAGSYSVVLGADGVLTLPGGNTRIGDVYGAGNDVIAGSTGTAVGVLTQGTGGYAALQWIGDTTTSTTNAAAVIVNSPFSASSGTVQIATGAVNGPVTDNIWEFGAAGNLTVPGNIIPDTDVAYDLGSPTNRFRDIYVSSSTIYLGTSTISISSEGQMLVNGNDAVSKLEYFGGEGYGPRDAVAIAWNTSTFTFDTPGKELLTAIYDLKPGNKIRATGAPGFDQEFTIVGNTREYIRSGGYQMVGIDVAETTSTNRYAWSLYLPVKDKSATIANGTWTVSVGTTGTVVFPNGTQQTGASISIAQLKTLVAASTDFANFKTRIAAL
jgi:hypothetical protein